MFSKCQFLMNSNFRSHLSAAHLQRIIPFRVQELACICKPLCRWQITWHQYVVHVQTHVCAKRGQSAAGTMDNNTFNGLFSRLLFQWSAATRTSLCFCVGLEVTEGGKWSYARLKLDTPVPESNFFVANQLKKTLKTKQFKCTCSLAFLDLTKATTWLWQPETADLIKPNLFICFDKIIEGHMNTFKLLVCVSPRDIH